MSDRWLVVFTKTAQKDARKVAESGLKRKTAELLAVLADDPFRTPPSYEKLVGDLTGAYSRRINRQHRIVYTVDRAERTVKVLDPLRMRKMALISLPIETTCRPFSKN